MKAVHGPEDPVEPDVLAMSRLQQGEDLALNEIMGRWKQPLADYIYRCLGTHADAMDLTQETFVRIYENRHRYSPTARFSRWMFTIATNLVRNQIRWKSRHPEISLETSEPEEAKDESLLDQIACQAQTASEQLETKERAETIRTAILSLPLELRTAIVLFEYEGLSHLEIAHIENCSPKAVELRLYRARNLLRDMLAKYFKKV